jgi:DNA ligase-1
VLRLSEETHRADVGGSSRACAESRERGVEGFILEAPRWRVRRRPAQGGAWWKVEDRFRSPSTPCSIYAQPGATGRRAALLTDYTFGVWHEGELVPIAKAYSGLSNAEIEELDKWIRRHTRERHGPVRAVDPVQVFELGFEAIAPSTRHRSGIAVRFPRMLRWRHDKPAAEADSLEILRKLILS